MLLVDIERKTVGRQKAILKRHGTVSEETTKAMAESIRLKTKTDFALSITGNLGSKTHRGQKNGIGFIAVSLQAGSNRRG